MKVGGFTQHHHRITAEITHFNFKCVISVPLAAPNRIAKIMTVLKQFVCPSVCLENTCAFVLFGVRVQNRVTCSFVILPLGNLYILKVPIICQQQEGVLSFTFTRVHSFNAPFMVSTAQFPTSQLWSVGTSFLKCNVARSPGQIQHGSLLSVNFHY